MSLIKHQDSHMTSVTSFSQIMATSKKRKRLSLSKTLLIIKWTPSTRWCSQLFLTASFSMMFSSMPTMSVNEGLRVYGSSQQSRMIWSLWGLQIQGIHHVRNVIYFYLFCHFTVKKMFSPTNKKHSGEHCSLYECYSTSQLSKTCKWRGAHSPSSQLLFLWFFSSSLFCIIVNWMPSDFRLWVR